MTTYIRDLLGGASSYQFGKKGNTVVSSAANRVVEWQSPDGGYVKLKIAPAEAPNESVVLEQLEAGLLDKQDNISIAPASQPYLQLTTGADGSPQLEITQLGIINPIVDVTATSLADFIGAGGYPSPNINAGDTLILANAPTVETWLHVGGSAGDASDFFRINTDTISDAQIRLALMGGPGINYNNISGAIAVNADGSTVGFNSDGAIEVLDGAIDSSKLNPSIVSSIDSKASQSALDTLSSQVDLVEQIAATASKTLSVGISNTTSQVSMGVIPAGAVVSEVRTRVVNDFAPVATLSVGSASSANLLLDPANDEVELDSANLFMAPRLLQMSADTEVFVNVANAGSSGSGLVTVFYHPVAVAV